MPVLVVMTAGQYDYKAQALTKDGAGQIEKLPWQFNSLGVRPDVCFRALGCRGLSRHVEQTADKAFPGVPQIVDRNLEHDSTHLFLETLSQSPTTHRCIAVVANELGARSMDAGMRDIGNFGHKLYENPGSVVVYGLDAWPDILKYNAAQVLRSFSFGRDDRVECGNIVGDLDPFLGLLAFPAPRRYLTGTPVVAEEQQKTAPLPFVKTA